MRRAARKLTRQNLLRVRCVRPDMLSKQEQHWRENPGTLILLM